MRKARPLQINLFFLLLLVRFETFAVLSVSYWVIQTTCRCEIRAKFPKLKAVNVTSLPLLLNVPPLFNALFNVLSNVPV